MQSTNFEFLRPAWPELAELGAFAELYVQSDPPSSRFKSRLLAEHLAMFVCKELGIPIVDGNFLAVLKELERTKTLPKPVLDTFHQIRMSGNKAVHSLIQDNSHALETVKSVFDLARWWVLFSTHSKEGLPTAFKSIQSISAPSAQYELEHLKKLHANCLFKPAAKAYSGLWSCTAGAFVPSTIYAFECRWAGRNFY